MLLRWAWTVASLMNSLWPMSLLLCPVASARRTTISRWVSFIEGFFRTPAMSLASFVGSEDKEPPKKAAAATIGRPIVVRLDDRLDTGRHNVCPRCDQFLSESYVSKSRQLD